MVCAVPRFMFAATLEFVGPDTVQTNTEALYRLVLDTEGEKLNALEGEIHIPEEVTLADIDTESSIFGPWIEEPSYESSSRTLRFSGIVPGGILTPSGTVLSFSIVHKTDRPFEIKMRSLRAALHDGKATPARIGAEPKIVRVSVYPQKEQYVKNFIGIMIACALIFIIRKRIST